MAANIEVITGTPRLVDYVLSDHIHVHVLYSKLSEMMNSGGDFKLMGRIANTIMVLMRLHSQAEMDILYPKMEELLGPMGGDLSGRANDEHAQVEEMIEKCIKAGPSSKEGLKLLKECCEFFFVHAEEEEKEMVPALVAKLSPKQQEDIVKEMIESKMTAPLDPQVEVAQEAAKAAAGETAKED